jgi:chromosome segregation ATPase
MSLSEILSFLKTLLQSEAEVIASFVTGVICTVMGVFALRKWVFPRRDAVRELARLKAKLARQEEVVAHLREELSKFGSYTENRPSSAAEFAALWERCAWLENENRQLVLDKQSLEKTIQKLRTDISNIEMELAHLAKWLEKFDEENARLSESRSHAKG